MKSLTQIRIISQDDLDSYLEEFPDEKLSFEGYINVELGTLFDDKCTVTDLKFISDTKVIIVYTKTI